MSSPSNLPPIPSKEELTETKSPVVELRNLHKTYIIHTSAVPALRGVSLTIFPSEFIIIYGTSGGGKTSLLNIIGTIDKPTRGELFISGQRITSNTHDDILADLRLNTLGFVFQSFNLIASMTALENVELPLALKGLSKKEMRVRAKASLEAVGLAHRMSHYPRELSGGEQQRVTIARAIGIQPKILLLDEPTGDLDTVNTEKILQLLYKMNDEQSKGKSLAHRVIWMRDGRISKIEKSSAEDRWNAYVEMVTKSKLREQKAEIVKSETEVRTPADYAVLNEESKDLLIEIFPVLCPCWDLNKPLSENNGHVIVPYLS